MDKGFDIAIDFDKVLSSYEGYEEGVFGEPIPGALNAVKEFIADGYYCYVFTARPETQEVEKWLRKYGFPDMKVSNYKSPAHVYVDDRAYRFTKWTPSVIDEIKKLVGKGEKDFTGYNKKYFEQARTDTVAPSIAG